MNKNRIIILLFFLITLAGFSFDGGGLIKTGISLNMDKSKKSDLALKIGNFDGISLWAEQNMDDSGDLIFATQASYLFKFSKDLKPQKTNSEFKHIVDLEMFKFSFLIPVAKSFLLIDVGRYGLADATSAIFNQQIDGVFLSYKHPKFSANFNIGYTGLLNALTNPINAPLDREQNKVYALAPSFIALNSFFNIPVGKYKHSIGFELNSFLQPKKNGLTKSYFSIVANGPIFSSLFFIFSGTGELRTKIVDGKKQELSLGAFINTDLCYYFAKNSAKLGFKTQWFSGGEKNYFDSFTISNASKVKFLPNTSLWKNSLYASVKPVPELSIGMDTSLFLAGKKIKNVSFYQGFEASLAVNYIILQDIFVGLNTGLFVDDKQNINSMIGLKGVISF